MSLMARPKQTLAEAKAREIIQKLGISSPDEIDVIKIAALRKIRVRERPLNGCDGMMVRKGNRAIISVRESISDIKKKRFVIAHELGHVLLHQGIKQSDSFDLSAFDQMQYRASHPEMEANYFAAELLMPSQLFVAALDQVDPSFSEISRLANMFNTTLSATAIQFVKYSKEPCAFIISKDLEQPWIFTAEGLGEFWVERRNRIHAYSVTAATVKHGKTSGRADDVSAGVWLQNYSDTGKDYITEEALVFSDSGIAYTLLWVHDEI